MMRLIFALVKKYRKRRYDNLFKNNLQIRQLNNCCRKIQLVLQKNNRPCYIIPWILNHNSLLSCQVDIYKPKNGGYYV